MRLFLWNAASKIISLQVSIMNSLSVRNCIKRSLKGVIAPISLILMSGAFQAVHADIIPYPNLLSPNPVTYTFTAATGGRVIAYFAGSTAVYENQLGMLVNGVLTSAGYGLDNKTSALGQSFDLGAVTAGDSLTFVLHNLTLGMDAYSDTSMNVAYDVDGTLGHNRVYSTPYTNESPITDTIPVGTFVSFEDLRFPNSDFDYDDENFVFAIVSSPSVPEPSTFLLLGMGLVGVGIMRRRFKK